MYQILTLLNVCLQTCDIEATRLAGLISSESVNVKASIA